MSWTACIQAARTRAISRARELPPERHQAHLPNIPRGRILLRPRSVQVPYMTLSINRSINPSSTTTTQWRAPQSTQSISGSPAPCHLNSSISSRNTHPCHSNNPPPQPQPRSHNHQRQHQYQKAPPSQQTPTRHQILSSPSKTPSQTAGNPQPTPSAAKPPW